MRNQIALAAACLAALAVPAAAAAAPPGPPGPPPGNGTSLPASPGSVVVPAPFGGATAVSAPTGPGLLRDASNTAFNRGKRAFTVTFACQANGSLKATSPRVRGPIGEAKYRCRGGKARATVKVTPATAARIARLQKVAVTVTATQRGQRTPMDVTLLAGGSASPAAKFWTDGHLQCTPDGTTPQATAVEPDFTYRFAGIPISTRGWVASYTDRGGWHWTGASGERRGRWDTWSSTPTGIVEWHPGGQVQPNAWTWGPIGFTAGQNTFAIGVWEIVYWSGGGPKWQWGYINAGTTGHVAAGGAAMSYCTYP
jgi:hypothetical protein